MPQVEKIPPGNPRNPYFRLWWEGGDISWETRVITFVNLFHRFLFETYSPHFYFEWEDLAISGDFRTGKSRVYIVFHCWFLIENQAMEDEFRKEWEEWMSLQEFEDDELKLLKDPKNGKFIWKSGTKLDKYQVFLPDTNGKIQILSNQHGYSPESHWYKGGVYENDEYFFFHNWHSEYGSWLEGIDKKVNNALLKNVEYGEDRFNLDDLRNALPRC